MARGCGVHHEDRFSKGCVNFLKTTEPDTHTSHATTAASTRDPISAAAAASDVAGRRARTPGPIGEHGASIREPGLWSKPTSRKGTTGVPPIGPPMPARVLSRAACAAPRAGPGAFFACPAQRCVCRSPRIEPPSFGWGGLLRDGCFLESFPNSKKAEKARSGPPQPKEQRRAQCETGTRKTPRAPGVDARSRGQEGGPIGGTPVVPAVASPLPNRGAVFADRPGCSCSPAGHVARGRRGADRVACTGCCSSV